MVYMITFILYLNYIPLLHVTSYSPTLHVTTGLFHDRDGVFFYSFFLNTITYSQKIRIQTKHIFHLTKEEHSFSDSFYIQDIVTLTTQR